MTPRAPLCLLTCDPARDLALRIADELQVELQPSRDVWFAGGEGKHVLDANVRGCDVYIMQRVVDPGSERSVYDAFTMLMHAVDAARCADADRVTVLLPYLPGSRQDKRKGHVREGVHTGLFARMLAAAGVSMVVAVEPHNEAMAGCFNPREVVFESVLVTHTLCSFLVGLDFVRDVVASTDVGGLERTRRFAQVLKRPLAALTKERDYSQTSVVTSSTVIGDVRGKSVLILDDMIDTAGSMVSAVESLWSEGATDVTIAAVHLLLSEPAWERLSALKAKADARGVAFDLVGTTSVVHKNPPAWLHLCPLEPMLAKVIRRVNGRGSVRALEER
ncbi:MAG: ribose-phosphate diphosphokinase [Rhodobacterales bacterium]|nr:ribose-phosphate diphosphokinase [Rhodobacterales bacterium]